MQLMSFTYKKFLGDFLHNLTSKGEFMEESFQNKFYHNMLQPFGHWILDSENLIINFTQFHSKPYRHSIIFQKLSSLGKNQRSN